MKKYIILFIIFFLLSPLSAMADSKPGNIYFQVSVVAFGKNNFYLKVFKDKDLKDKIQLPKGTKSTKLYVSYGGSDLGVTIQTWEDDEKKITTEKFGKGKKFFSTVQEIKIGKKEKHFSVFIGEGVDRLFSLLPPPAEKEKNPPKKDSSKK